MSNYDIMVVHTEKVFSNYLCGRLPKVDPSANMLPFDTVVGAIAHLQGAAKDQLPGVVIASSKMQRVLQYCKDTPELRDVKKVLISGGDFQIVAKQLDVEFVSSADARGPKGLDALVLHPQQK